MGFEWGWDNIDWIAVVLAVVANMALGFIWYGKFAFLPMWQQDNNVTDEMMQSANMPVVMGGMIVMVLVSAITLSLILGNRGRVLEEGLLVGAMIGLGITAMHMIPHYTFARKTTRLALIDSMNTAVGITLSGLIIGAMM